MMPEARKGERDEPVGYVTQQLRRRQVRPVHSRRKAILEQAEAVFAPKPEKIECPTKN
jgi:hypothetical protein